MKKCSVLLAILLILSLALTGCGGRAKSDAAMEYFGTGSNSGSSSSSIAPSASVSYDALMPEKEYYDKSTADSVGSEIYENPGNKIIRTANLTIQTTDFEQSVAALNALTEQYKGYYETSEVSSGSIYDSYSSRSAYYVVRIPKENFTAFRDGTGGIGHVFSLNENNQDVGEIYYDTEARLETLTVKRDRLLELLKKATDMKDIIELENSLADVQYQIDQHTSTLRKYDSLIGYSTFYIRLNEVQKIVEKPAVTQSFGEKLFSNLKSGAESFVRSMQNFAYSVARNLIDIVIFAVILVVVIVFVRKKVRKAKEYRNYTPSKPAPDDKEDK